jgi:hypothetical protein
MRIAPGQHPPLTHAALLNASPICRPRLLPWHQYLVVSKFSLRPLAHTLFHGLLAVVYSIGGCTLFRSLHIQITSSVNMIAILHECDTSSCYAHTALNHFILIKSDSYQRVIFVYPQKRYSLRLLILISNMIYLDTICGRYIMLETSISGQREYVVSFVPSPP